MGFSLKGIVTTNTSEEFQQAARQQWPLARIKAFENEYYKGLIIAEAELVNLDNYDKIMAHNDSIYEQLVPFSALYPAELLAYVWTDSHGGTCFYDGFVCQAGQIILDKRGGEDSEKYSYGAELGKLRAILKAVGVRLPADGHFLPFTRTFFDEPKSMVVSQEKNIQQPKPWWQFWK
ncbi:hypothetical protein [Flexibacter flexilis]|nr:hypothetical protein [Flexibacter flexilis]